MEMCWLLHFVGIDLKNVISVYILQQWPGRSDFGLWIEYFLGIKRMCLVFHSVLFIDVLQVQNTFFFLSHDIKWMKWLWSSKSVVQQWHWYWQSAQITSFGVEASFLSGHFVDVISSFLLKESLLIGALEYLISTTPKFWRGKGGFMLRAF